MGSMPLLAEQDLILFIDGLSCVTGEHPDNACDDRDGGRGDQEVKQRAKVDRDSNSTHSNREETAVSDDVDIVNLRETVCYSCCISEETITVDRRDAAKYGNEDSVIQKIVVSQPCCASQLRKVLVEQFRHIQKDDECQNASDDGTSQTQKKRP
jgi:hypothetical protein